MNITELIKKAHENAVNKGFYPEGEEKNIGELLMLCVSELGEALEAHRKNKHAYYNGLTYSESAGEFKSFFEKNIKDTFEDELADTVIRIFDLCGYKKIDLAKHIKLKMKYNATREHKHGKRY